MIRKGKLYANLPNTDLNTRMSGVLQFEKKTDTRSLQASQNTAQKKSGKVPDIAGKTSVISKLNDVD